MESNDSFEVIDNEVPLKTDERHNQSDNGLSALLPNIFNNNNVINCLGIEISREEDNPSNSVIELIDGQNIASNECETKDESQENGGHSEDKSTADGSRHQYSKVTINRLNS